MKKRARMKVTNISLPEVMIAEILPRLPAKSLFRFKRVSKSWCSFISSKCFIKAQLEHARNTPLPEQSTIFPTHEYEFHDHVVRHCPVDYLFSQQQIQDVPRCPNFCRIDKRGTHLVGCCNGLCCVDIGGRDIVLWNPTTGLSHKLPPAMEEYVTVPTIGFGYDESNDDYKVLLVYTPRYDHHDRVKYLYRLYSLKANSWKELDNFMVDLKKVNSWQTVNKFQPYIHEERAVTMNGKLHWATHISSDNFNIVTFDLGRETAGSFEQPCSGRINFSYSSSLGVIQGCLCVVCEEPIRGPTQVWIMKEYGVKESWCKLMTLPCLRNLFCSDSFRVAFSILCISVEGELLFQWSGSLVSYNPKTKHLRNITESKQIGDIAICIQSLVSPLPTGELD